MACTITDMESSGMAFPNQCAVTPVTPSIQMHFSTFNESSQSVVITRSLSVILCHFSNMCCCFFLKL